MNELRQFYIFIITGFCVAVFDLIDSAFGNNLDVDSICVMSSFMIISWCMCIFGGVGVYAYNIRQSSLSECLILQVSFSLIVSAIVLLFNDKIPYIYNLTDRQYELISQCLFWYSLFFVVQEIALFLYNYIALKCKNKVIVITNILFYVIMIVLDILVVMNGGKCYHLVITTGISYSIILICYLVASGVISDLNKPNFNSLKLCFMDAKDMLIDRILGKVATVTFNVTASYLGTEYYAIHSVGYNIATSSECITDEISRMQIIALKGIDNKIEKYKSIRYYEKR